MQSIYQDALTGTLKSPRGGPAVAGVTFSNKTPIPINLYWISYDGIRIAASTGLSFGPTIPPGMTTGSVAEVSAGCYFLVTATNSGAFIGVLTVVPGQTSYMIDETLLTAPNDIGAIPAPTPWALIPLDSPRVLVGFGRLTGQTQPGYPSGYENLPLGTSITREQYWERQSNSYCLAPNEVRTVGLTTTNGKQATSSSELSMSAGLGLGASVGWGAISASISSSLSASSTVTQQVTVTEQTVSYISTTVKNPFSQPAMFLHWQLMDVTTIYQDTFTLQNLFVYSKPIASVLMAESPGLVSGPYNTRTSAPLLILIDCGSRQTVSGFAADMDFSGGSYYGPVGDAIDISQIPAPAPPQALYQTMRLGSGSATPFAYTFGSLTAAASYTVTLHFAELIVTAAGARQFNVSINGLQVLTNFDVIAEVGKQFKAVAKNFTATADDQGIITIQFFPILESAPPIINAIVVTPTLTPEAEAKKHAGHKHSDEGWPIDPQPAGSTPG